MIDEEQELEFINIGRRRVRVVHKEESMLYDKRCPLCGSPSLIFKWDNKEKRYMQHTARCSSPQCKYGN